MLAHDFARERDGAFLLRIEDIDPGRTRSEFVDGILEDLLWLGLEWDADMTYQSERLPLYAEALKRLKDEGLVYRCVCTRAEIAAEVVASAAAPHGSHGPIYPGTCRNRIGDEADLADVPHVWRLDLGAALVRAGPVTWMDGENEVRAAPEAFGDVVLARKDAPVSYHLAVTVDDAAQGVTDVVRGRDLYAATHVHRLLQALLDLPSPTYHHHPLLLDADGRRLAKRHGAPTIAGLRERGLDPAELLSQLRSGRLPAGYSAASA
jgi:glutamyl-Q tRNA(Asp) synthetase